MPPKVKVDISAKDPTVGTSHKQPTFEGTEGLAEGDVLEREIDLEIVEEVVLVEEMLDFRLEVALGQLHAIPVVDVALSSLKGCGIARAVPQSSNGRRVVERNILRQDVVRTILQCLS